jgi:hypothetical protein
LIHKITGFSNEYAIISSSADSAHFLHCSPGAGCACSCAVSTTHSGKLSSVEEFQIGGIQTFPGLLPGELRGSSYWYAGTTYLWRLFDLQPVFGQTLYAGLRFQAGEMNDRFDGIDDGTLYGISGSIRGRTPIGSFTLSLGFVDNGSRLIQFSIGRSVGEGSILDELY